MTAQENLRRLAWNTAEIRRIITESPIAVARLWIPECQRCPHPDSRLAANGRGMPLTCPEDLSPQHRCPSCSSTVEPRTCQRCAIHAAMLPGIRRAFILGGNRTGKSEGEAQHGAAVAIGGLDAGVRRWASINQLPLDSLPMRPGGGYVWASAPDSNDSRRFVRPKYAKYLPPSWKWRNRFGSGEAECLRVELGKPGGVIFKSHDQGRDGFQGDATDLQHMDEEPLGEQGRQVVTEADQRCIDYGGRMVFTMTPLSGWTRLLQENIRNPSPDVVVRYLDALDNPHIPRVEVEARLIRYSIHEREARRRGAISALEGRVYGAWDRALHVVHAFWPEGPEWDWYEWIDFGVRNPTAYGLCALDTRRNELHLVRSFRVPERLISGHAAEIHQLRRGRLIQATVADPAGTQERLELVEHDIPTVGAWKDVRAGINAAAQRLATSADGRPGFVVHDRPENVAFIEEIEGYVWDQRTTKSDQPDTPLKKDDHHMDGWRYLCLYLARMGYGSAGTEEEPAEL